MKENVKSGLDVLNPKELLGGIVSHGCVALLSFVAARAPVLGQFAPFGLSFAAGLPQPYILTAGLGTLIGYFIPVSGGNLFRYFAALFAICTIRLLLCGVGKFAKRPVWSVISAFSASLATSLATVAGGEFSIVYAVVEAVLAAAGAFFVFRASAILDRERQGLNTEQLTSVAIVANILFMGIYPVAFEGISLGQILAVTGILAVARYSLTAGGAVAGCVVSLFIMLCGGEFSYAAIMYSVGGLFAGLFAPLGKIASALSFVAWSSLAMLFLDPTAAAYTLVVEAAFGAALFLCLPKSVSVRAGKLIAPPSRVPSLEGLRRALTMRLFFASEALSDVSQTVTEVSSELQKINAPDFEWVLDEVKRDACIGCRMRSFCWESHKSETTDAILCMTKAIKAEVSPPESAAPDCFRDRCLKPSRVGNSVVRHYSEYTSRLTAENRIEEIRGVVSDQFDGIANMLFDLASEFESCESYDNSVAQRVSEALRGLDIRATDCACRIDKYGRMTVELRTQLPPHAVINRMQILNVAEAVCNREFDPPAVTRAKNEVFITLCEKANLTAEIGVSQLICRDGMICGDAYTTFNDGKGHTVMLLSDGMGTGARAAVDGAMASGLMERLLKAGFGYDCALKIVNSSMLFKSTDESLATVDIASIDLFTGQTELLKVGAAPTLIRRSGRTGKAQSTSLPAGILRGIGFDKATLNLRPGDIVLMVSDGVTADGTDWICAELEAYKNGSAQQLADKIASTARRRRTDGHEDDITVMAALLQKAV